MKQKFDHYIIAESLAFGKPIKIRKQGALILFAFVIGVLKIKQERALIIKE